MCINLAQNRILQISWVVNEYLCVVVSITHPPMVSVIVVYKNKAKNAASKLL